MRNKVFAAFLCVMVCGISKADPILAADCTITASLCSYTPSAVGGLQLSVSDIHGAVSSYTVSDVSSASHSVTFTTLWIQPSPSPRPQPPWLLDTMAYTDLPA